MAKIHELLAELLTTRVYCCYRSDSFSGDVEILAMKSRKCDVFGRVLSSSRSLVTGAHDTVQWLCRIMDSEHILHPLTGLANLTSGVDNRSQ